MGCIRVDKITEYLCDPLRKCLKDEDPYVRKTAAVCVAKLHDINPNLVEDQGFLDQLKDLLSDSNPMASAKTFTIWSFALNIEIIVFFRSSLMLLLHYRKSMRLPPLAIHLLR